MAEAAPPPPPADRRSIGRKAAILLAAGIAVALLAVFGVRYYLRAQAWESTDDAFVDGRVVQISPRVPGQVMEVPVRDNQMVRKGDLLVALDPRDYQVALDKARANLRLQQEKHRSARINVSLTSQTTHANVEQASSGVQLAQSSLERARGGVDTSRHQVAAARDRLVQAGAQVDTAMRTWEQALAQVKAAEAEAVRAATDVQRYQKLYAQDEVSRQALDRATATARRAAADLEAARQKAEAVHAQVAEARAQRQAAAEGVRQGESQVTEAQNHVSEVQAQVDEARARLASANTAPVQVASSETQASSAAADVRQAQVAVQQAVLSLSYTRIYAPQNGRVTRKNVEVGNNLQPGQALMALVGPDVWITANFKETQLGRMQPGQSVELHIDAFPDRIFKGHVDSVQAGSGARFSLLPPENATGNFVKVVQRVPVKIVFDEPEDVLRQLGPGMSVVPEVKVR